MTNGTPGGPRDAVRGSSGAAGQPGRASTRRPARDRTGRRLPPACTCSTRSSAARFSVSSTADTRTAGSGQRRHGARRGRDRPVIQLPGRGGVAQIVRALRDRSRRGRRARGAARACDSRVRETRRPDGGSTVIRPSRAKASRTTSAFKRALALVADMGVEAPAARRIHRRARADRQTLPAPRPHRRTPAAARPARCAPAPARRGSRPARGSPGPRAARASGRPPPAFRSRARCARPC